MAAPNHSALPFFVPASNHIPASHTSSQPHLQPATPPASYIPASHTSIQSPLSTPQLPAHTPR
ncbi:hypothetical protein [Persicirhabdus sediminis]|uniref:Uncharacterized protein n=1 Tax=Persicirhabdus sediminis TaxID=454144 RepID=A0A8J7MGZ2_9BACT|nr:hypothetical protein [Persicirhabdus sediminis]MBK1792638.1 hypothetical protein [Persicirhabdus sediminis]